MKKTILILLAACFCGIVPVAAQQTAFWQVNAEGNYSFLNRSDHDAYGAGIAVGKAQNNSFIGMGTGWWKESNNDFLPVYLKLKYNFTDTTVSPYGTLKVGVSFNTTNNWHVGALAQISAGVDTKLSASTGLYFEAGAQIYSFSVKNTRRSSSWNTGFLDNITSEPGVAFILTMGLRFNMN